jgi:hypothetical protein
VAGIALFANVFGKINIQVELRHLVYDPKTARLVIAR